MQVPSIIMQHSWHIGHFHRIRLPLGKYQLIAAHVTPRWTLGRKPVLRIPEPLKPTSIASAPGAEGFGDFLEEYPSRFVRRPRHETHARCTVGVEVLEFRSTVLAVIHPIKVLGGLAEINAVMRRLPTQTRRDRIGHV